MMIPNEALKQFAEALARRDGRSTIRLETVRSAITGWARCYAIVNSLDPALTERRLNAAVKHYADVRARRYRQPELLSA